MPTLISQDHSFIRQALTFIGLMIPPGALVFSAMLWASDSYIDETYATDTDLMAVQENLNAKVDSLNDTVESNTRASGRAMRSVDSLTLVVLDIQIKELELLIAALETEKRDRPDAWADAKERAMRDSRRRLADFLMQRELLFKRIISPS